MNQVYAEDVNYFKTSTVTPDTWIDKAKNEIKAAGGRVLGEAFGHMDGRTAAQAAAPEKGTKMAPDRAARHATAVARDRQPHGSK